MRTASWRCMTATPGSCWASSRVAPATPTASAKASGTPDAPPKPQNSGRPAVLIFDMVCDCGHIGAYASCDWHVEGVLHPPQGLGIELIQGWSWSLDVQTTATGAFYDQTTQLNWSLVNFGLNFF